MKLLINGHPYILYCTVNLFDIYIEARIHRLQIQTVNTPFAINNMNDTFVNAFTIRAWNYFYFIYLNSIFTESTQIFKFVISKSTWRKWRNCLYNFGLLKTGQEISIGICKVFILTVTRRNDTLFIGIWLPECYF